MIVGPAEESAICHLARTLHHHLTAKAENNLKRISNGDVLSSMNPWRG
jgi:hypothetical protein